ncbi:MAG TPA: ATP-binding cassette domain-containing protein, partial [Polyangiaceae bacterium]|nr:ATP-binding cassette domain-containing protein [Polyangiaceae bacterium]
ALEYLERVGLADWADHLPSELSGGQQQRVAVARALISNPRILLADEPTGALDSKTSDQLMTLLAEVNAEGVTILVVTHEAEVAKRAHRTIVLVDGEIARES